MKSYKVKLSIERFNDGKYKVEQSIGGSVESKGCASKAEVGTALDEFVQAVIDHETKIDNN